MAKLSDIIGQIQAVLPKYSDKFNSTALISGVSSIGAGVWEVTTSSAHGLTSGNYATIKGVTVRNEIIGLSIADGIVTATTEFAHDLTLGWRDHDAVNITGFAGLDSNNPTLLSVPTTTTFTFANTVLPTGTGYLNEDRLYGMNGRYEVTVTSTTKFRITTTTSFTHFTLSSDSYVVGPVRFTGEVDAERSIAHYKKTTQTLNNYWGFVVNNPTSVSFSRQIQSDANQKFERADEIRYECNQTFSIYVFAPATNSMSGRQQQDDMVDIRNALCRTLCGVEFDSGFDTEPTRFVTTYRGDGYYGFVGAYYIHVFEFETVYNFNPEDGVVENDTRAFRNFEIDLSMQFDDYEEVKKEVDGTLPATA